MVAADAAELETARVDEPALAVLLPWAAAEAADEPPTGATDAVPLDAADVWAGADAADVAPEAAPAAEVLATGAWGWPSEI